MPTAPIAVLGPQRQRPNLAASLEALGLAQSERIATVTAGWEERESEDEELHEHLFSRSVNLRLYERSDAVLREDPELRVAVRWRTERLREAQELYRIRVNHALEAVRELLRRAPSPNGTDLLVRERTAAIEALRALDAEHERAVVAVREEFIARSQPYQRPSVLRQRAEVEKVLAGCEIVCVAGGHVAILIDVLRLFDFGSLLAGRALAAWSAGAMALSERIVLFHDSPPQGQGSAELLDQGLGVVTGILPLPHAKQRLKLDDPRKVALLALRFRPLVCIPLDSGSQESGSPESAPPEPGSCIVWDGRGWRGIGGTKKLGEDGTLIDVGGAEVGA